MQIQKMKEGEEAFSPEREAKCQNNSVGNVETKSNGHRIRVELETLIYIMRSLRIEVKSYKEDNDNMMKEKNKINSQMMQILNHL
jgi:hypothetical protein